MNVEIDFLAIAGDVARALLGEPNAKLSSPTELRFGNRGSLAVDLKRAVWHDHEAGTGGGMLDLIGRETGATNGEAAGWLRDRGFIRDAAASGHRRIVAAYPYHDEDGALIFQVVRFEPKDFRQRAPDGAGGWRWSLRGVRRVIYRLPELLAAPAEAIVFVTEGEKDADRLAREGLVATTCPGGAGKWRKEYLEALAGRRVVVLPDNDEAGRNHANAILESLRKAHIRAAVLPLDGLSAKGDVSDWLAAGGEPDGLMRLAEEALAKAKDAPGRPNLGLVAFDDDAEPLVDDAWSIEDVVPDEGLGGLYGAPGGGKTFAALDMSFAIAGAAETWRGKYVKHGSVLYFGMEGGRMFRNRVAAYTREKGRAPHFYRSAITLDLRSTEDHASAVIREAAALREQGKPPVRLIVVDTLARAMAGGNENAPEDMGAFVALCEAIRKEVKCFLLVVHHSGKDQARGMRGHTALLGAVDTELHLEKGEGGGLMTVTKQRDGEDGERFGYRLRRVVLGISPRGKEITSCVVDDAEAPTPRAKLGTQQQAALEALKQFVADRGSPCPGGTGWPDPGSRQIVDVADFLPFLTAKMTNEKPDDRRRTAKRSFDGLIGKGLVQTNEGSAWII